MGRKCQRLQLRQITGTINPTVDVTERYKRTVTGISSGLGNGFDCELRQRVVKCGLRALIARRHSTEQRLPTTGWDKQFHEWHTLLS